MIAIVLLFVFVCVRAYVAPVELQKQAELPCEMSKPAVHPGELKKRAVLSEPCLAICFKICRFGFLEDGTCPRCTCAPNPCDTDNCPANTVCNTIPSSCAGGSCPHIACCKGLRPIMPSEHLIAVNVNEDCVTDVNELIQLNLAAAIQYLAKSMHFRQYDSEFIGMATMFGAHARMKINDAKHLMKYLIHRGLEVHWDTIAKPPQTDWAHPSSVIKQALVIEKNILNKIIETHTCAQQHHDPDLMHDMADRMIVGEENTIFELGSYISHLQHDGVDDTIVLPIISKKMYTQYKDYKDCFHADDEHARHDY